MYVSCLPVHVRIKVIMLVKNITLVASTFKRNYIMNLYGLAPPSSLELEGWCENRGSTNPTKERKNDKNTRFHGQQMIYRSSHDHAREGLGKVQLELIGYFRIEIRETSTSKFVMDSCSYYMKQPFYYIKKNQCLYIICSLQKLQVLKS